MEEDEFNDPPPEGNQFFIASLEATYTGTESSTSWVDMNVEICRRLLSAASPSSPPLTSLLSTTSRIKGYGVTMSPTKAPAKPLTTPPSRPKALALPTYGRWQILTAVAEPI